MSTTTTRNSLTKPDYTDTADIAVINANSDIIDSAVAKCKWDATTGPVVGDDSADGYVVGSRWWDTTAHKLYECESNSAGAAIWRQIYPAVDADTLDGNHAAAFAVAAKGVTNGDSHDHSGGDGAAIVS